jgi:hypothetical protein
MRLGQVNSPRRYFFYEVFLLEVNGVFNQQRP